MPANQKSLRLVDAYRSRLLALSDRVETTARELWPRIEDLDGTTWPEQMASVVTRAQTEGVRLTAGYLAAYLRSESGRGTVPAIDSARYAGVSRDGRPLAEALRSPIIGVLSSLKQGDSPDKALALGLVRARRSVAFEAVQTPREALLDAIEEHPRVEGFQRQVAGTCGACMALSGEPNMEVHPGCQCLPVPKVVGVKEAIAIPTGTDLFRSLTKPEQDRAVGPEAAELVREGAPLKDFVKHNAQEERDDFITQRPVEQVSHTTQEVNQ
jgi:hypothetical protein